MAASVTDERITERMNGWRLSLSAEVVGEHGARALVLLSKVLQVLANQSKMGPGFEEIDDFLATQLRPMGTFIDSLLVCRSCSDWTR